MNEIRTQMISMPTLNRFCLALLLVFPMSSTWQDKKPNTHNHDGGTSDEQKTEVFKLTLRGEQRASDRTPLGFRIYEGSSGTKVFITYGTFRSPEKAEAELHLWLKPVKKVISEEQNKDILGQPVGYRATAVYVDMNSNQDFNAVLWTNGSDYWQIECLSLATALEFEKRIRNGAPLSLEGR